MATTAFPSSLGGLVLPLFLLVVLTTFVASPSFASAADLATTTAASGAHVDISEQHLRRKWWRSQAVNMLDASNGAFTELVSAAADLVTAASSGVDSVHSLLSEKTSLYSKRVHETIHGTTTPMEDDTSSLSPLGRRSTSSRWDSAHTSTESMKNAEEDDDGPFGVFADGLHAMRSEGLFLHASGAIKKANYQKHIDKLAERVGTSTTPSTPPTSRRLSAEKFDPVTEANRKIAAEKHRLKFEESSHAVRQDVTNVWTQLCSSDDSCPSTGASTGVAPPAIIIRPSAALNDHIQASLPTTLSPATTATDINKLPQPSPKVYSSVLSGRRRRVSTTTTTPAAVQSARTFAGQDTTSSGATYQSSEYISISQRGSFCEEGSVAVPAFLLDDPTTFLCTYTTNASITRTDLFSAREFFNNQSTVFTSNEDRQQCSVRYEKVVCACAADATVFYSIEKGKKDAVCINTPLQCTTSVPFPVSTCTPRDPRWENSAAPLLVSDGCLSTPRSATNYTFQYRLSCSFPEAVNGSYSGYYIPGERQLLAVMQADVSTAPTVDPASDLLYVVLNATEGGSPFSSVTPMYEGVEGTPFPGHDVNITYNALRQSNLSFPFIYQSNATSSTSTSSLSFTSLNPILYGTPISGRSKGTSTHITRAYFADGFYNFNVLSDQSQLYRIYLDDVAGSASGVSFSTVSSGTASTSDIALFWGTFAEVLSGNRTLHRSFDIANITDESFFAGGRLYGEAGISGTSASGDRTIAVIDITDAPSGNYQKPKRVLNVALVAGVTILVVLLLAGAVYLYKQWRAKQEVERNRVHAHLLLSNDYHNE